jgi:hypothetical protein
MEEGRQERAGLVSAWPRIAARRTGMTFHFNVAIVRA